MTSQSQIGGPLNARTRTSAFRHNANKTAETGLLSILPCREYARTRAVSCACPETPTRYNKPILAWPPSQAQKAAGRMSCYLSGNALCRSCRGGPSSELRRAVRNFCVVAGAGVVVSQSLSLAQTRTAMPTATQRSRTNCSFTSQRVRIILMDFGRRAASDGDDSPGLTARSNDKSGLRWRSSTTPMISR